MQSVIIDEQIKRCKNNTLRTNAIAAVHRGTQIDQNRTLHACIMFNKAEDMERQVRARLNGFTLLVSWFGHHFRG